MNRTPVSQRRLRQIVEHTGYRYTQAFERPDSKLLLAVKPSKVPTLDSADWVDQDTWQVWPAVRAGIALKGQAEITRSRTEN